MSTVFSECSLGLDPHRYARYEHRRRTITADGAQSVARNIDFSNNHRRSPASAASQKEPGALSSHRESQNPVPSHVSVENPEVDSHNSREAEHAADTNVLAGEVERLNVQNSSDGATHQKVDENRDEVQQGDLMVFRTELRSLQANGKKGGHQVRISI